MPKQSKLLALPKSVPIDWFDPIYWNEHLTLCEHANYTQDGNMHVALPHNPELYSTWSACVAWKNLPVKEFMEKYGNDVLTQYNLPTEEELEQLDQYDAEQVEEELGGGEGGDNSGDD
jgi:hypothetical protein